MKTFINDENFVIHVKNDLPDMGDIEDRIDQNLLDLKRTDCSIVFAGKFVIYDFKTTLVKCSTTKNRRIDI